MQAWNALILDKIYEVQFEELGLEVTDTELIDMVQGNNISPEIQSFFTDPETGQFSKENVTNFLGNLSQADVNQQNSWIAFERSLIPSRKVSKYDNLISLTNYATSYETKEEYYNQTSSASIDYVYVPYSAVNDSVVSFENTELKEYLEANENEYQSDEYRAIEYVVFEVVPSTADSTIIREEVDQVVEGFKHATNDSIYAGIYSDNANLSFLTYNAESLGDSIKDKEVGYITQPAIVDNGYEIYKLSDINEVSPDSIIYMIAKIRKEFFVSDETIDNAYRKADLFAKVATDEETFRSVAKEQSLNIEKANKIQKNAQRVGGLADARALAMWAYNEGDVGKVSEVKGVGEDYVVALMTGVQKEGLSNLEDVRNRVEKKVSNKLKSTIIIDKLNAIESDDFDEIASRYGERAKTGSVDISLNSNSISGVGYAPEAIGLAFAMQVDEVTHPIVLDDGIIIMRLTDKQEVEDLDSYDDYYSQVVSKRLSTNNLIADFPLTYFRLFVSRNVDEAIKKYAEIKDMRYKFF